MEVKIDIAVTKKILLKKKYDIEVLFFLHTVDTKYL